MKTDLRHYIRNIEDFPKPGVTFRDITPLLLDPRATDEALDQLCDQAKGLGITKVAAIESRGFFFGSLIAHRLGVGYIPVRKKGKLPFSTLSVTYDLEYGTDTLEIHTDAIVPGDRVLIHDDVLATGGHGPCRGRTGRESRRSGRSSLVPDGTQGTGRRGKALRPSRKVPDGILKE